MVGKIQEQDLAQNSADIMYTVKLPHPIASYLTYDSLLVLDWLSDI